MVDEGNIVSVINSLTVVLAFAIILISSASATGIVWEYDEVSPNYIAPDSDDNKIMQFSIIDGKDSSIVNTTFPGDNLYTFEKNSTMFLNQSDSTNKGLNGFNEGEDILNVSLVHSEGSRQLLGGGLLGNFSSNISFTDGGNKSDGFFNGDQSVGDNSEAVVISNTSQNDILNSKDYVLAEGKMRFSDFSDRVQYTDSTQDGKFNGSEALISNYVFNGYLNSSDDVLLSGNAGLIKFDGSWSNDEDRKVVRYVDHNHSNSYYKQNAILRYETNDGSFIEQEDEIVVNGTVGMDKAEDTNLKYFNNTPGGFQNLNEPIYYDATNPGDDIVNQSDVRIGSVQISSLSGLQMMVNGSLRDSSLEIGKEIHNVTNSNTGYGTGKNGTFRVLEYGSADNTWDPSSGDQEVLIYDPSNDSSTVSGQSEISDIYVYDSDPSNNNIPNTMELGDRFNDTQAEDVTSPSAEYIPEVNLTFDGGDSFYNISKDNVTLNVSYGGTSEVVILGPDAMSGTIGYEGTLHDGGYIRFWDASTGSSGEMDGFYADMNEDGKVSGGDLRLGGWNKTKDAGLVKEGDIDIGINITRFDDALDNAKVIHKNSTEDTYFPGNGTEGQREAVVSSSDSVLDSQDEIIRSGVLDVEKFSSDTRFTDYNDDGKFRSASAIVKDNGSDPNILEDTDEVLKPGNASLNNLSDEVRYVENGTFDRFEKGSSEAILWDSNIDGKVSRGYLNQTEDKLIVSGHANLMNFTEPPKSEGETGKVFLDSNRTGRYNAGEDILKITLITNGTSSNKINGTEIFNFANTTRHNNQSFYQDGDAIINDTDNNSVYRDVFRGLGIENTYDNTSNTLDYDANLTHEELDGSISIYHDSDRDGVFEPSDEEIGMLSPTGLVKWEGSGFNKNIRRNERFFLSLDVKKASNLDKRAFGMFFESYLIQNDGNTLDSSTCYAGCSDKYLDAHPPEFKSAITGGSKDGNNSLRDKIYVEILEEGAGLNDASFTASDFDVNISDISILKAVKTNSTGNLELHLNDSLKTNETPRVELTGTMEDYEENRRLEDQIDSKDGLRPLIQNVNYQDEDVDGTLDLLEVVFSEKVNYTSFDASGWTVESNGVPCIQALAPGKEASFCSTEDRMINVTSGNSSSLFREALNLSSMAYVNSSDPGSSKYEIGGELYDVTNSNTGYGGEGGFVVHEYNYSGNENDSIWNPNNTGDQDVLVYSVNGTDLTVGDILIYDERSGNDNITIEVGQEFASDDIISSESPVNSYSVGSEIGYIGSGSYSHFDHNVSVNISYNSPRYGEPNSTFVNLASNESTASLGKSGTFNPSGSVGFWNTSGSEVKPVLDGIFVDVDATNNISEGDVRLGQWTLPSEKQLYRHEIKSEVDSETAGSSLNNTLINLSGSKYDSLSTENIIDAEIINSTRQLNVSGNITSVNITGSGEKLNISFNTSKYNVNLSKADEISISYYSKSEVTFNDFESIEINTNATGGLYNGTGILNQDNTSVVRINATALEGLTGTSDEEPVMNFTVLTNLVTDQSGNTLTNATGIELTDDAGPAVTEASVRDVDNDAELDRVNLNFSENLDDSTSNYRSAFNLSNGTINNIWIRNSNSSNLTLNVSSVGGTAFTPNITIENNTIRDQIGNTIRMEQNFTEVKDRANPILMNAEIDPYNSTSDYTFVDLEFSENSSGVLDKNEAIQVSGTSVEFNNTDYVRNISVNYSNQLQTGNTPNITLIERLEDESGNRLELYEEERVAVNTFRRQIIKGWNFVSFPIASKSTPYISEVVNISKVEVVWTRRNSSWITYDPDAPENDFSRLRGGKGYYLKSKENFTLSPNVENKFEGSVTGDELDEFGANLTNGWNLIGNTQEFNQKPGNNTAFVSVDAEVDPIYGQKFNNGSKVLKVTNPVKESSGNINHNLEVGEAYWADVPNGENQTYRAPIGD